MIIITILKKVIVAQPEQAPFEFALLSFSTALDIFEAVTDSTQQKNIPDRFCFFLLKDMESISYPGILVLLVICTFRDTYRH